MSKMGSPPDVSALTAEHNPLHDAWLLSLRATDSSSQGRTSWRDRQPQALIPSRWESSPTRRARSRSWGSPTPTSPGWSSATSTPRAGCSGGSWSCISRTARRTTPSRRRRRPSWSSRTTSTSSSAASTAPRGRPSRARPWSKGKTLYIYPEQYEGGESDPLIFCTGPGPAQQVDPFIPWLMRETGARTFYFPSADYIWPHVLNARVREVVDGQRRVDRRRGVLPARPHGLRSDGREDQLERRRRGVQHDRAARGLAVLRAALQLRLREPRRAARLHVLRRELPEHGAGRPRRGAVRLPRLLPGRRAIRSARSCSRSTTRSIPATRSSRVAADARASTAGCGCGRLPWRRRARSCRRT